MSVDYDSLVQSLRELIERQRSQIQTRDDIIRAHEIIAEMNAKELKVKENIITMHEAELRRMREQNELLSACIDQGKLAKQITQ